MLFPTILLFVQGLRLSTNRTRKYNWVSLLAASFFLQGHLAECLDIPRKQKGGMAVVEWAVWLKRLPS